MCRALDSHGFADLKAAILAYSSFTSVYAVDDPRRFKLGKPDEVFRSTERAWAVAPSSKRIVEDILALPRVLSKIIEYEGCVVPDEVLRHGRRAAKWESAEMSTSGQKAKPRSFTRIETLASSVPPHPDVDPARAMLRSPCFQAGCVLSEGSRDFWAKSNAEWLRKHSSYFYSQMQPKCSILAGWENGRTHAAGFIVGFDYTSRNQARAIV